MFSKLCQFLQTVTKHQRIANLMQLHGIDLAFLTSAVDYELYNEGRRLRKMNQNLIHQDQASKGFHSFSVFL